MYEISGRLTSVKKTVNRTLMKLFCAKSMSVIELCQKAFEFLPMKLLVDIKVAKFLHKLMASENHICHLFSGNASRQMNNIRQAHNLRPSSTANEIGCEIF